MSSNAGPWTSSTRLGVSGRPWTWYPGLVRQRVVVPTWERGTLAVRYLFHSRVLSRLSRRRRRTAGRPCRAPPGRAAGWSAPRGIPAAGAVCGMIRAHKRNESIREIRYSLGSPRDRTAIVRIPGPIARLRSSPEAGPGGRGAPRAGRPGPPAARRAGPRIRGIPNPILGTRLAARPRTVVGGWDTWSLRTHILGVMHMDHGHVCASVLAPTCVRGVWRAVRSRYMFWSCPMQWPDVVHLIRITDRNYLELVKAAKRRSVSSVAFGLLSVAVGRLQTESPVAGEFLV